MDTLATTGKPWYQSTGIWGGVVAVAASALAVIEHALAPDTVTLVQGHVLAVVAAVGGLVSIWGRWRATQRVG